MKTIPQSTPKVNLLEYALAYSELGINVIPVVGKTPICRNWTEYQTERQSEETVRRLFRSNKATGVAIICGKASGDLVCRDFDEADAYEMWARRHSHLARILPTVKTSRGFHVYCRAEGVKTKKYSTAGELRGEGAIVVAPPSHHPDGGTYEWLIEMTNVDDLDYVDISTTGLDKPRVQGTGLTENTERRTENVEHSNTITQFSVSLSLCQSIEEAVAKAVPTGPRMNHDVLFVLARAVYSYEVYRQQQNPGFRLANEDWETAFDLWYRQTDESFLRWSREIYWLEFCNARKCVTTPLGMGLLSDAFEAAVNGPMPACANEFTDEKVRNLIAFCAELQRRENKKHGRSEAGEDPSNQPTFFLGYRDAAEQLGIRDHNRAGKMLGGLVGLGILEMVEKGRSPHYATRYRFIGRITNDDGNATKEGGSKELVGVGTPAMVRE